MKKLIEKKIGEISPITFRPTETQKAVLNNISKLLAMGQTVTKQDAVNIPDEQQAEKELPDENLDGALDILINVGLVQKDPDGTLVLSSAGQSIADEMDQGEAIEDELPEGPLPTTPGTQETPPNFESFSLIASLNDLSKFLKG